MKVFNHEHKVLDEFDKLNTELQEAANNAQFYSTIMFPILGNISYVNYAITAAVGGYLVIINWMDIGDLPHSYNSQEHLHNHLLKCLNK